MPASADIYGNSQPVQPPNMLAQLAQVMQAQGLQGQNMLAQYGLRKAQRGDEETNALAELLRGGADLATPEGQRRAYSVAPTVAGPLVKSHMEAQKERSIIGENDAKTAKLKTENVNLAMQQSRDMLGSVNDPQAGAAWVQAQFTNPDLAPIHALSGRTLEQAIAAIPTDAAGFARWKQQNQLGAEKLVAFTTPDANTVANNTTSLATNAATNATSSANNAATNATSRANNAATIAGENTRHAATLTEGKTQVVQTDNGPVLVNKADGTGKAVTGPDGKQLTGVTKALTDTQAKSLLFGSRMEAADKILGQLANEGTTTSIPGSRTPIIGGTISALSSENRQMLDQAKRDFMTAVLRRESGAAISSGEFDTADKQYFPQIGDSDKVKAQKDANRKMAIRGVLVEVPEKQRTSLQAPTTTPAAGPKAGTVQDGYRFKGGNPADRNSWEKV